MGERVTVTKFDDTEPEILAEHTVSFDWEGKPLEIDLSATNYHTLLALIEPYVKAARKRESGTKPKPKMSSSSTVKPADVRAWAKRNGYPDIADIGKLPVGLAEEFQKYGGRDKPEFADPDPVPADRTWNDLGREEQDEVRAWVEGALSLQMPRARADKDRIIVEAWGDRNVEALKAILIG